MPEYIVSDLREGYRRIVAEVKASGERVESRGMATREILGASIVLTNPRDSLPLGVGRKLNRAIAAAEALQLIGGESYPELMCRIAPNFRSYMDGGIFHGAYGPRVRNQFWQAANRLRGDHGTRQALITLWDPSKDNQAGLHDYPCTTSMQFFVRDGRLDLQVYMRSNDVWRGLAYDAFQFTQLQHTMAREVEVPVGTYRHYAASLHLYESDVPAAVAMLNTEPEPHAPVTQHWTPRGVSVSAARFILAGGRGDGTPSARWYREALAKYL